MKIPVFFVLILFLLILLILLIYMQIYKSKINKALNTTQNHPKMPSPHKVATALTIVVLTIGIIASYLVGYKTSYDRFENNTEQLSPADIQTFYANIQSISENTLTVNGIPINDQAYRGVLKYDISQGTAIFCNYKTMTLADLKSGDLVAITLITAGGDVVDIYKIQLISQ